jgi:2-keto-myo-inositol isomerase
MLIHRRAWLTATTGLAAAATAAPATRAAGDDAPPFRFGLNTSTLMGHKLPIDEELRIAADVGYDAVEPWIRELDAYAESGKPLADLGKLINDLGLEIPSAIGFFDWAVDDEAQRRKGFEEARRSMERVQAIGGKRVAAPPSGATDRDDIDLRRIADRYRELLELGRQFGVVPEVEVWGFSKTLGRLADAAYVAIAAGHPDACILPDVYHLYRGGSDFDGLRVLNGAAIPAFHMNDYPANPPRAQLTDAQRVYPGDGVAPLDALFRTLRDIGFHGVLSLELFNREYWQQDPKTVARNGLEKMRAAVAKAFA